MASTSKTRIIVSSASARARFAAHVVLPSPGRALVTATTRISGVDKIFGPGNTWVTEAKAQVDRDPDGAARDYPAGPSEVLVIADASANAAFVASDLLSQAEHGVDSQVLLLTTSAELAAAVVAEIDKQKARLTRRAIVDGALACSSAIVGFGFRSAKATLSPGILQVITASCIAESALWPFSPLSDGGCGSPCTSMIRRISARGMRPPRGLPRNLHEQR